MTGLPRRVWWRFKRWLIREVPTGFVAECDGEEIDRWTLNRTLTTSNFQPKLDGLTTVYQTYELRLLGRRPVRFGRILVAQFIDGQDPLERLRKARLGGSWL